MSFKENLLQKLKIDKMAQQVIASIGPVDSGRKLDKKVMRELLELAEYTYKRKRDLDLYIEDIDAEKTRIIVLDNDLAVYNTSVYDVAMRKSPTVKEMMNPFNVVKILKDTDVVLSKKEDSVKFVQQECIANLDLSFNESDLDEIAGDGLTSLENGYSEGVIECIELFGDILDYTNPPKAFKVGHHKIIGKLKRKDNGEDVFGPMVLYSMMNNSLKLIDEPIGSFDRDKMVFFQHVVSGQQKASAEGPEVFQYLKTAALKSKTA